MRLPIPRKKTLGFYSYNLLVSLLLFGLSLTPFLIQANQQIIDLVHSWGRIEARKEIVVLGIDDKSLEDIGAWPWDRSVFAQIIDKLNAAGARTIGIDVLFLEKRSGDDQLATSLTNSSAPVVLASKLLMEEKTTQYPFFQLPAEQFGFINFSPDPDSKVRSTYFPGSEKVLHQTSFSFRVLEQYFSPTLVHQQLTKQYPDSSYIYFTYTNEPFTQVSLSDLLHDRLDPAVFKDKIVLIGTTTVDLKSGISDNVSDIFGHESPGIILHANVINSFLLNRFLHNIPIGVTFISTMLITLVFSLIFSKVRSNLYDLCITVVAFIALNIAGFIAFELGYNWPFFLFSATLIFTYIAALAQKYIYENRQRRFIQTAFAQYINPELMKRLVNNPDQLKLGGEKREMTVMFSDLRGFTSVSEKMDPEDLIALLNNYLDEMCEIILDQKGMIDKFIGDAIMALWNAPLDDDHHRENAIKTSVLMLEALDHFNQKYPHTRLNIGVGINTGEMVVGNIGSRRRFDYTVLGDNVNLAARVEGLTKKYGLRVLLTEQTVHNVNIPGLIFRLIDRVIVKGKSKPIRLFQPLSDTPEHQELKKEYEKAFALYEKGEFNQAKKIWSTLTEDPTAKMMIQRLTEVKDVKNWQGVWEWHEK
jgi:adenylate cyclase